LELWRTAFVRDYKPPSKFMPNFNYEFNILNTN
jgi:hypothetical protein